MLLICKREHVCDVFLQNRNQYANNVLNKTFLSFPENAAARASNNSREYQDFLSCSQVHAYLLREIERKILLVSLCIAFYELKNIYL